MSIRSQRKLEHFKHAISISSGPQETGFDDLHLIHQAVSSRDLESINTEAVFLRKKLKFPLIINALTGGAPGLEKINEKLALTARHCGIAMAVGSQTAALEDRTWQKTFQIVREVNPDGVILANVSALADWRRALEAVEMIHADGIQLHLNLAQELVMNEGDRNFNKLLENIGVIKEKLKVPVIVKEVGFGLSMETVKKLQELDIRYYDIGGAGGTNFIAIENARKKSQIAKDLVSWGIPTVISLIEINETLDLKDATICASGGVYSALDIIKSLVLGAHLVGIASPFLKLACRSDEQKIIEFVEELILDAKKIMLLIDAGNLEELPKKPIIIMGKTREWLELRGIDASKYARRANL
ncbi:MAG: type 2 isopentenyl-diphosphate Delta-isomerase [Clostridia bacterium]|nr:type 2 isopentenyl-diphosphate Delta-isomerase [Clostridia bacterium]